MQLEISSNNINDYKQKAYIDVTTVYWTVGYIDKDVLMNFPNLVEIHITKCKLDSIEGIDVCKNLKIFVCEKTGLTSLNGIQNCEYLTELWCINNEIVDISPIEHLHNLVVLGINYNKIRSIKPVSNLTKIKRLYCSFNELESLEGIENCHELKELDCSRNNITNISLLVNHPKLEELNCYLTHISSLNGISECKHLRRLFCFASNIESLTEISECQSLEVLYCNNCNISSIEGIENCLMLRELCCQNNSITNLQHLVYLTRLTYLRFEGNPLDVQTIQVERMLRRFKNIQSETVYNDRQNVHNTCIQKTVCQSVQNLLLDQKPVFDVNTIINSDLGETTKRLLLEYIDDKTIHSKHLITYEELLAYVWARIVKSEYRQELFKILAEQISESECKCFTGRFNRTLSVLVGFYEDIKIEISDNSRISAIIISIKDSIIPYDANIHKQRSYHALIDAGYSDEEINIWLDAIE